MDPLVFEEHSYEEHELENTGVYTAHAVTLAMKKPLEEENILLEYGTIALASKENTMAKPRMYLRRNSE